MPPANNDAVDACMNSRRFTLLIIKFPLKRWLPFSDFKYLDNELSGNAGLPPVAELLAVANQQGLAGHYGFGTFHRETSDRHPASELLTATGFSANHAAWAGESFLEWPGNTGVPTDRGG